MSKRTRERDLDHYLKKLKKIERKILQHKVNEENSEDDAHDDAELSSASVQGIEVETNGFLTSDDHLAVNDASGERDSLSKSADMAPSENNVPPTSTDVTTADKNETAPTTSSEVLLALGDLMPDKPSYGPAINSDLARIWTNILKNGIPKEAKEKIMEKLIPENCVLLKAPKLNPEIIASVTEVIVNRDKKIEAEQNQLGIGLTIVGTALSSLINNESVDRLKLISVLSEAGRVLTDLHNIKTNTRRNLVYPTLDKKFLEVVKDVERDEFLYGKDLTERIKSLQSVQRSGKTIQKPVPNFNRPGNFKGPPRFNQQRTPARSGHKKMQSSTYPRRYQGQQYQSGVKKPRAPPAKQPPART